MSATALKEREVGYVVSDEARQRIDDTRVRDLAFHIKRVLGGVISDSRDVELIASIVLDGVGKDIHVDRMYVKNELIRAGRSPHKADLLSGALFK
jgi:hypothetical protein